MKHNRYSGYHSIIPAHYFVKRRVLKFKRAKWLAVQNYLLHLRGAPDITMGDRCALLQSALRNAYQPRVHLDLFLKFYMLPLLRLRAAKFLLPVGDALDLCLAEPGAPWDDEMVVNSGGLAFYLSDAKSCKIRGWGRLRSLYGLQLRMRQLVTCTFFNIRGFRRVYKQGFLPLHVRKNRLELFRAGFLRMEFRLDIALWRLGFFASPQQAGVAIKGGMVWVNGKLLQHVGFLSAGDIVQVKRVPSFGAIALSYVQSNFLPVYFDVDYYTSQFVVLADWTQIAYDDANFYLRNFYNLTLLKTFLVK
jgi:ribosomal protein S4